MQITTRAAKGEDRAWLLQLRQLTMNPHLQAAGIVIDDAEHQARVDADFTAIQILCRGNERLGMIKVVRTSELWRLVQIQLVPAHQGTGIGALSVTRLLREADHARVPVELNVLKVNPAQHLYARLGFVTVADRDSAFTMRYSPDPTAARP